MSDMFEANLEKIFESIHNTIRLAAEFGLPEQKELSAYSKMAEKLVSIEAKYNIHKKALRESMNEVTLEEFDRRYQTNAVPSKTNPKQLKRYQDFIVHAKYVLTEQAKESDDEDLQVEQVLCDIDPITKRPLEVPVRNRKCNHVYEKSSIKKLLEQNPRTRCPVMGCAAHEFVTMGDLVEDKMLQQRLRMQRNEASD